MYVGRDMTELTMVSKSEWKEDELAYFHHSLQQILPYLNAEGQSIYKEIVIEIESRGGLQEGDASWTHGTKFLTIKKCSQPGNTFCLSALMGSKTPPQNAAKAKK